MTNYYLGVDLGSTTSKAIIIDEREEIVGRGITNTRSNYDVAVEVAKNEAMINGRFTFMRQELERAGRGGEGLESLFSDLEIHFRYEQHLDRLLRLKERAFQEAARSAFDPGVIAEIFDRMVAESYELFLSLGNDKSRFFRDIAGMSFMRLADEISSRSDLFDFETLMSVYDKSIVHIENELIEVNFPDFVNRAVDSMRDLLAPALKDELRLATIKAVERPSRLPPWSARAMGAPGCRFHGNASSRRSSATASGPITCIPRQRRCSISAARTPRPSNWITMAW